MFMKKPMTLKSREKAARSVIDSLLVIAGNLTSEKDIQVEGTVNGDIRCAHLIVSRDAKINGNIIAEEVIVRGYVTGTIRANVVVLQDTAQVASEIYHKGLAIDQGACFDGASRRREEPMQVEIPEKKSAMTSATRLAAVA
jgi:cytoskeletal protein CcmA (bactofilin family)